MLHQDQHRRSKDSSLCVLEAPKAGALRGGINSEGNVSLNLGRSLSEITSNWMHQLGNSAFQRLVMQKFLMKVMLLNS